MYDNNPTLEFAPKHIDESKQGEAFELLNNDTKSNTKAFYIESYGCAMNFSDSEIVASVLSGSGYRSTRNMEDSDLILINTCSIREKAEETVRKRLSLFNKIKRSKPGMMIGVLGCMAERLKSKFLEEEKLVDIVVGPDAYRDIPNLLKGVEEGQKGVNVFLSREETYADISPLRLDESGILAFISIMRGCDNMCSFCVVPYTRGRERSRDAYSIVAEAQDLYDRGYREVTLLGQNVDSYKWINPATDTKVSFAKLMEMVANVHPDLRVRFSTSHPKDMTDDVLHTMAQYENICNYIHLPVQSGNSRILELMNRSYDSDWYKERIESIRKIVPDCAISSDIITGFCSETEEEHQDTLDMIVWADFSLTYTYYYSERPGTSAQRKFEDDVDENTKKRRLAEIIRVQRHVSLLQNKRDIGKQFKVLIEGDSKKSEWDFKGRNDQNKVIVFPKVQGYKPGDYALVHVIEVTSATLMGEIVSSKS